MGTHPLIDQLKATPGGDSAEYDDFRESINARFLHPDDLDMHVLWRFRDLTEGGEQIDFDFDALALEILAELAVCPTRERANELATIAFQAEYTCVVYASELPQLKAVSVGEGFSNQASIFGYIHEIAKLMFDLEEPEDLIGSTG